MLKRFFWIIALTIWSTALLAQERYTVALGNFMEAQAADFSALYDIGFVYAAPLEGGVSRIMVGGYDTKAAADRAVAAVRAKGYPSAYAMQIFLNEGMMVNVIQLGVEKANARINWERYAKAGDLYGIMGADDLRIVVGLYASTEDARKQLSAIRQAGFKDAFIRTTNSVLLHKLAEFETGIKKPLIPLNIQSETSAPASTSAAASIPVITPPAYDQADLRVKSPQASATSAADNASPATIPRAPYATTSVQMPSIRGNIRRRSVLDLQQALKAEGIYTGLLDGMYGSGTASAYQNFANTNRQMLRYQAIAFNAPKPGQLPVVARLQNALNAMDTDQAAVMEVTTSGGPLAKAWQAYWAFVNRGASNEVNQLMNSAIQEAFNSKTLRKNPPFDHRATYAYNDLGQLLLHLHYIHSAPGIAATVPCWISRKHPREMTRVYESYANQADADFSYRGCDQALTWPEVAIMEAIAQDLGVNTTASAAAIAKRAKLFNVPSAPLKEEEVALENWQIRLWRGLDAWAQRDILNQDLIKAFRMAYFQSQVRLEDHFMDKGFNAEAARFLALSTLQTLLTHHLQRFL